MDVNMILKPFLGAIIGYSTNWLAIKMLFKPHAAKYIGKVRIPFTPGLIPRERDRIARSLGTAVGERLLTEEVIVKELLDPKVIDHIKDFVIGELLEKDLCIKDIMVKILGDEYDLVVDKMAKGINAYIVSLMDDDVTMDQISAYIKDYLTDKYPYNTMIAPLLPSNIDADVEAVFLAHRDQISQYIVDESQKEGVVIKLKAVINELVMEKVGALGAMFLNPDDVADSILDYVKKTVFEEDVQEAIVGSLIGAFNQSKQMQLSELMPIGQYDVMLNGIITSMTDGSREIIRAIDLKPFIASSLQYFLLQTLHLTSHEKEQIETQVEAAYKSFVKANVGTFLETFELKSIVENEVNAFSVSDVEALIFTIVDKELKAITWFGALLGFVMGLVFII